MSNSTDVMDLTVMEKVVIRGDLSSLSPQERFLYYSKVCESLGLNPLTKPFDYLQLDNKLVLYAKRDCTDQLRRLQKISISIASRERIGDVYCVTARGTTADGRFDESMGVVSLTKKETAWDEMRKRYVPTGNIVPLSSDELANALMKAETKAKRRVTLSLAGLGMMDESEIETVDNSQRIVMEEAPSTQPAASETPAPADLPKPPKQSSATRKQTGAAKSSKPQASEAASEPNTTEAEQNVYQLLDYGTGTSPKGVTYARMKVANLLTGEQDMVLVNKPDIIEQTTKIGNESQFYMDLQEENGFKIVQGIRIVGEAA